MDAQKPVVVEGGPVWIDLGTHDIDGAVEFYTALFGWDFHPGSEEFGGYRMIHKDGLPIGGAMTTLMGPDGPSEQPQGPTAWSVYLRTADIESTVTAASEHGAQVIVPAMDIADLGKMAMVIDPSGAAVGLWQSDSFDGIANCARVGTPVWFESMTTDFDTAQAFYRDVFAWDVHSESGQEGSGQDGADQQEEGPQVRYVTHGTGETTAAGLCDAKSFLPEGTPSYWRIYFGSADLQASVAKVEELGGSVLDGPVDTPYGPLVTVADPQGASFQILEIAEQYR